MNIFLILLLLSIRQEQHVIAIDYVEVGTEIAIKLWEKIFAAYSTSSGPNDGPPKLMIRHGKKQKNLKLDKLMEDPANKNKGPFTFVYKIAEKLAKNKDIDQCELYWYDTNGDQMYIDDDDSLVDAIEAGPDLAGNKRLIDVICESGATKGVHGGIRYRDAKHAYDFALMAKHKPSKHVQSKAEKSLEEARLGSYSLVGEGVQLLDVDGTKFQAEMKQISEAYEWGPKQIALLNAATASRKISGARSYVEFKASDWKIVGSFSRLFAWESEEGRYSMYCATSKFEFTIPKSEREGDFKDKYLWGDGGTVKQEFIDLIKSVLEYKAIEQSEKQIPEPQKDLLENKKDL
eukprot:706375_1